MIGPTSSSRSSLGVHPVGMKKRGDQSQAINAPDVGDDHSGHKTHQTSVDVPSILPPLEG